MKFFQVIMKVQKNLRNVVMEYRKKCIPYEKSYKIKIILQFRCLFLIIGHLLLRKKYLLNTVSNRQKQ